MDLTDSIALAAKGMKAQGVRMRVISENLANADTTAETSKEDPYKRKIVTFKNELDRTLNQKVVEVGKITEDQSDFRLKYDPSHPSADEKGYVKYPNVNPLIEMMDLKEAQRSYEANLGTIQVSKAMVMRTLDLLSR